MCDCGRTPSAISKPHKRQFSIPFLCPRPHQQASVSLTVYMRSASPAFAWQTFYAGVVKENPIWVNFNQRSA